MKKIGLIISIIVLSSAAASILFLNPGLITTVKANPYAGDDWTPPLNVSALYQNSSTAYSDRAIAVDRSGNVHMVYYGETEDGGPHEIFYVTNSTGSWTWQNVSNMADILYADQYNPVLALDENNVVHVVWFGAYYSGSPLNIFYSNNSGGTWTDPLNISKHTYSDKDPSIFVDMEGNIHVAFVSLDTNQLYYVNRIGGSWSNPQAIAPYNNYHVYDAGISIAVDSKGHVYIAYTSDEPSNNCEVYVVNNTGGSWGPPYNVSRDMSTTDHNDLQVSMDIDAADNIHLSWVHASTPVTFNYVNCVNGVWGSIESNHISLSQPSVKSDYNGKVHAVFNKFTTALYVYYTNNTMMTFGTPVSTDNSS